MIWVFNPQFTDQEVRPSEIKKLVLDYMDVK